MEGGLAVERFYGRRVSGWECLRMRELCRADAELVPAEGRPDALLVARSAAIWLAMCAHVFFKIEAWAYMPAALVPTAIATPLLMVVFGWGLARKFGGEPESRGVRWLMNRCWPLALAFYIAIAVTLLFQWISGESDSRATLMALIFNDGGVYAGIWMTYCWMMLLAPFLVAAIERWRLWAVGVLLVVPWLTWRTVTVADEITYFWGFLLGWGGVTGPSVMHATSFLVFGYLIGMGRKRWSFAGVAVAVVAIAGWVLWRDLDRHGLTLVWQLIAYQGYRLYSHPVYAAFGIMGAVLVLLGSVLVARFKHPVVIRDVLYSFGRNSLFAYTFGNVVLTLVPEREWMPREGLLLGAAYLIGLALLTDDVTRWRPRFFGRVSKGLRAVNLRILNWCRPR